MATYTGTDGPNRYTGPRDEENAIFGLEGDDTLTGGNLSDTIEGGAGSDILTGGAGTDFVSSGDDPDGPQDARNTIDLGDGDDYAIVGFEIDIIDGGPGRDFVDYEASATGVSLNLQFGRGYAGDARGDSYTGIEGVFGSLLADTVVGGRADDNLFGLDGADQISGGGGSDRLDGNAGADRLTGGQGADLFFLTAVRDSTVAEAGRDLITDFSTAVDVLALASLDANVTRAGNQSFTFIDGRAFSGIAGQLRTAQSGGDTFVYGDVNGDRRADFAVQLDGLVEIQETNFLL